MHVAAFGTHAGAVLSGCACSLCSSQLRHLNVSSPFPLCLSPINPQNFIYVEAEKEAHVRDAIKGLRTIFVSKGVALVPLNEMVDAITVNRKAKTGIGGSLCSLGSPGAARACGLPRG